MSEDIVTVGRLGRPHGVRGWQRIHSFTEPYENIQTYADLFWHDKGQWCALDGVHWKIHHDQLLIKLPFVDSPEDAKLRSGAQIGAPRSAFAKIVEQDEYYWADLIGAEVNNVAGDYFGRVKELLETGAHDVLVVVDRDGHEVLIPFTASHVVEVKQATEFSIVVDWFRDW
ncbi:MAG: ribosome maturation factor RimM [Pseudomonadota bacterium]